MQLLVETLNGLPGGGATLGVVRPWDVRTVGYDATATFKFGAHELTLLVEIKGTVFPRDAHQIAYQLNKADALSGGQSKNNNIVPMLLAQAISPGAKEFLRTERIAFCDSGGSLFLARDAVFIDIDRATPASAKRVIHALFTGSRARALLVLLANKETIFSVQLLSESARISVGNASEVLQTLEQYDWVESRGHGPTKLRRLVNPTALLDAWSANVRTARPPKLHRYYLPLSAPGRIAEHVHNAFAAHDITYAITGEAAAQHYAPFLTNISQVRCRVVFSEKVEFALKGLEAQPTPDGANFAVVETTSEYDFLLRDHAEGLWYAHPIQVYVDLLRAEGRGPEMAEHLRRERIGF